MNELIEDDTVVQCLQQLLFFEIQDRPSAARRKSKYAEAIQAIYDASKVGEK